MKTFGEQPEEIVMASAWRVAEWVHGRTQGARSVMIDMHDDKLNLGFDARDLIELKRAVRYLEGYDDE